MTADLWKVTLLGKAFLQIDLHSICRLRISDAGSTAAKDINRPEDTARSDRWHGQQCSHSHRVFVMISSSHGVCLDAPERRRTLCAGPSDEKALWSLFSRFSVQALAGYVNILLLSVGLQSVHQSLVGLPTTCVSEEILMVS
jgi:hypothetical protein